MKEIKAHLQISIPYREILVSYQLLLLESLLLMLRLELYRDPQGHV